MNEEEFVLYLRKHFPFTHGLGIGDDASVVDKPSVKQLITTDLLIEDVHFRRRDLTCAEIARKALAVNLSDIAAMGGVPQYFYLGLGFPAYLSMADLTQFFQGLKKEMRHWQVELAGGDFSRADKLLVAITLIGKARKPVYRDGAQTGDLIAVSGPLGESALGWRLLQAGKSDPYFSRRHKVVIPEVNKGQLLARYAHAMIDISDGLLLDLQRILHASQRGARLQMEKIPLSARFRKLCQRWRWQADELLLSGGEDYKLLFTLSPSAERRLRARGLGYHVIGEITRSRDLVVTRNGRRLKISKLGYDHFQAREAIRQ